MKRTISVLLAAGLIIGMFAMPAVAKKKKKPAKPVKVERVVELTYQGPGAGVVSPAASGGICPFSDPASQTCIEIFPEAGEKYIKVEMADATGLTVGGFISQGDTTGDGIGDLYGDFCGGHPEPIAMQAEMTAVRISFYEGACADASGPSVVTTGTITVTFSNLP